MFVYPKIGIFAPPSSHFLPYQNQILFQSAKSTSSSTTTTINSGNLYYFSWFSFLVSISIFASCYSEMTGGAPAGNATDEEDKAANGEIQVENLPTDQEQL